MIATDNNATINLFAPTANANVIKMYIKTTEQNIQYTIQMQYTLPPLGHMKYNSPNQISGTYSESNTLISYLENIACYRNAVIHTRRKLIYETKLFSHCIVMLPRI